MTEQRGPDPDVLRAEAERLVAAGLAAVSVAADRIGAPTRERGGAAAAGFDVLGDMLFGPATHRRHSVANDSPECCLCPVCRVIAAARQPSPTFADRLATGVGFMAGSAARVLRGVAGATDAVRPPAEGAGHSDPWATATAGPAVATGAPTLTATVTTGPAAPATAAAATATATAEPPASTMVAEPGPRGTVAKKAVKKAVVKKAVVKKAVPKQAATRTSAKRAEGGGSTAGTTGQ